MLLIAGASWPEERTDFGIGSERLTLLFDRIAVGGEGLKLARW